ncbi:cytochrome c oxidase assembly protein [Streptomyces viridosporus]|uniref:cytochrome c oxidase assembly protein n=1 Tax=Streptomyces viridosporus TaxID=67581 RepID=UPI0037020E70
MDGRAAPAAAPAKPAPTGGTRRGETPAAAGPPPPAGPDDRTSGSGTAGGRVVRPPSTGTLGFLCFTPLHHAATAHPAGHWLLHARFLLSGCLFAHAIAGPDPAPRPGPGPRDPRRPLVYARGRGLRGRHGAVRVSTRNRRRPARPRTVGGATA